MFKRLIISILLIIINILSLSIISDNTLIEPNIENNVIIENKKDYLGIIEIPKLKLKRYFYKVDDEKNTVEKNTMLIEKSSMPDEKNSNIIFAAHRGRSKVAFFDKLHLIEYGDDIIIYYNNRKYTYQYNNRYDVPKNGHIKIIRDLNKTSITLITCKKGTNKQTVFIGYLTDNNL